MASRFAFAFKFTCTCTSHAFALSLARPLLSSPLSLSLYLPLAMTISSLAPFKSKLRAQTKTSKLSAPNSDELNLAASFRASTPPGAPLPCFPLASSSPLHPGFAASAVQNANHHTWRLLSAKQLESDNTLKFLWIVLRAYAVYNSSPLSLPGFPLLTRTGSW